MTSRVLAAVVRRCQSFLILGLLLSPATTLASELDEVRKRLGTAERYDAFELRAGELRVSLEGYLEHWDLELGGEKRLIVVSQMRGGRSLLLAFTESGSYLAQFHAGAELASLALCDLNSDGVSEVILDQLVGWGTGVLDRAYVVFLIDREIREVWTGLSLQIVEAPGSATAVTKRGFLRCEPSGWDVPYSRLFHRVEFSVDGDQAVEGRAWRLIDNRLAPDNLESD
jgi:hypothetical protein